MKDDDFKLLRGFADRQMNRRTDICDCRVAFATEKFLSFTLFLGVWWMGGGFEFRIRPSLSSLYKVPHVYLN